MPAVGEGEAVLVEGPHWQMCGPECGEGRSLLGEGRDSPPGCSEHDPDEAGRHTGAKPGSGGRNPSLKREGHAGAFWLHPVGNGRSQKVFGSWGKT